MSAQRTSFGKLERDRAKKAKAAAKRERRQGRANEPQTEPDASGSPSAGSPSAGSGSSGEASTTEVLELLASIHERYDAGGISLEELEERKAELLGRLEID
jgi:hypothetical protein